GRFRVTNHYGDAFIAAFTHFNSHRDRSQEWYSVLLGEFFAAAFAKNVVAIPRVRRNEITHVLDHAEHGHGDRLEHAQRPAHIDERDLLRGRYQHCSLDRHELS